MPRPALMGGSPIGAPRGEGRRGGRGAVDEEKKKPALPARVVLRDALELIQARRGRLVLGFGLLLVNRLAGLVLPGVTKIVIDDVIGKGRRELLGWIVVAAGAAILLQAATSFLLAQVVGKAAQRSITDMRRRVQRHVSRLPVAFFDQTKTGSLLSRVMTDAEGLRNLVGTGLVEVAGGIVTAVLALFILFSYSVKLTLLTLGVLSLFGFVLARSFRTLRPLFRERSRINAEVSGRLTESLAGIRVVKAYRAERREALTFTRGVHRLFRNVARTMTGFSLVTAVSTLLFGAITLLIMAVGATEILAGRMTLGSFVAFTAFLALLVGPVVQMVSIGSQITEAFAGLERIREIRDEQPEDAEDRDRSPMPRIAGTVEFRDVGFEYRPGTPVLHDIRFTALPGTSTALVGPSGAGKSTLIGLVAAFYRPTTGKIFVDGRDLFTLRLSDYRSQLGVVLQENFLFDGSVFENIAFARPDATREEVLRAAAIARCEEFVRDLADGYDTIVGERGVRLSGGQRQRVAIARAILADPRILILDEATSSLDSESEAAIQEGLAELMRGRTTFVIAHRLSTIRRADTILVVEGGRIIERGKHEELLARGGRYADLYTRQYGVEANLFLNPGELPDPTRQETAAATAADSAVGALPLLRGGGSS
ncbi:MAG: ABC transporter ATP-binding protein [Thermoanaerobaculia bacterium]|nr:ABC transporter ATP-binding protein [Thermoanaerobaculia bacterium]